MAVKNQVVKVWIEEGCIVCDACETTAPDVFEVLEDTCIVRPAALSKEFTVPRSDIIEEAAEECPVDVIKFDMAEVEVPDDQVKADAEKEEAKPAPAAKAHAPAAAAPAAAAPAAVAAAAAPPPYVPDYDPKLHELIQTAKSRGGAAGIRQTGIILPEEIQEWQRSRPEKLPPDIRHARAMEVAAREAAKSKEADKADPSRRTALAGLALTTGWVAFGAGTAVSAGPAFVRFLMPNVLEEPDPRVRVGEVEKYSEMPVGDVNEDFKPQGVWMIRQPNRICALNIICTHLGCIPNWLANDRKFKCPCHGSGFKPSGINFEGPAPRPLERFKVFEADGQIVVDKSKKFQYERGEWENPDSFIMV
jgi:cytochrome b6-f complex iron-sulfur subunit